MGERVKSGLYGKGVIQMSLSIIDFLYFYQETDLY